MLVLLAQCFEAQLLFCCTKSKIQNNPNITFGPNRNHTDVLNMQNNYNHHHHNLGLRILESLVLINL